jgi:hypothetical protein
MIVLKWTRCIDRSGSQAKGNLLKALSGERRIRRKVRRSEVSCEPLSTKHQKANRGLD